MTLEAATLLLGWGRSPIQPYPEPHILRDLTNEIGRPWKDFVLVAGESATMSFSDLTQKAAWLSRK